MRKYEGNDGSFSASENNYPNNFSQATFDYNQVAGLDPFGRGFDNGWRAVFFTLVGCISMGLYFKRLRLMHS